MKRRISVKISDHRKKLIVQYKQIKNSEAEAESIHFITSYHVHDNNTVNPTDLLPPNNLDFSPLPRRFLPSPSSPSSRDFFSSRRALISGNLQKWTCYKETHSYLRLGRLYDNVVLCTT